MRRVFDEDGDIDYGLTGVLCQHDCFQCQQHRTRGVRRRSLNIHFIVFRSVDSRASCSEDDRSYAFDGDEPAGVAPGEDEE